MARSPDHSDYQPHQIFFTKWQLRVDTQLQNIGRLENGSVWVVEKILTHPKDRQRSVSVASVKRMDDSVYLRNTETRETRVVHFQSLTYSAIWQIYNYRTNVKYQNAAE